MPLPKEGCGTQKQNKMLHQIFSTRVRHGRQAINPSRWIFEFKASPIYIMSSRPAKATQGARPCQRTKQIKQPQKYFIKKDIL